MRTLKLVLVSVCFFLSANVAHPLGVGDIKVNSALNEPLNAEISLFSVRAGEVDNIRVKMATPAEFARAGIDRPLVLSYLKFNVERQGDTAAIIRVTSKKPIKEPFLDFLVEVDWTGGRILREYTLLLDPPVYAQRKAAPVQAPKLSKPAPAAPAAAPAPAPAPVASQPAPARPAAAGDDLFPRIDIGAAAPAPQVSEAPAEVVTDAYTTRRSDTLWSVAERLRPADVSTQQMMMALLRANPDAFANSNINGLKSGQVLRIPDHDTLVALSKRDALRAVLEQHAAWREARGELASTPTAKGTAETSGTVSSEAPASTTRPGVKLVTPKAGEAAQGQGGSGKDLDALRQELALVNEQLASKSQENDDLQVRLQELEEQIQSMERLLALKNQSLEELQNKLGDQQVTPPAAPAPEPEAPAPEVAAPEMPAPAEPVAQAPAPVDTTKPLNPYAIKDLPKVEPARPVAKPQPKPPAVTPVAEPGIMDTITGMLREPMTLAMVAGVVVALLALMWIMIRRRRVAAMGFPESILTERGATTTVSEARQAEEETSLLSDFTASSMGSTLEEAGEVDPLAEADVYLAYNKYQQAEELLQGAIEEEPDRTDLKVKLLEVYSSARNADAFAQLAEDVHSNLEDTNTALWDKVAAMGAELCPGNPLFGAGAGESVLAIDEIGEAATMPETAADEDLEFDLGELSVEEAEPAAEAAPAAEAEDAAQAEPELEMPGELSLEPLEEAEPAAEETADDLELDLSEFESLELETEPGTETQPEEQPMERVEGEETAAAAEEALDFGDLDLEALDAELSMPEAEMAEAEEAEAETADLGMDEVATKLDLARAYIDMGDPDGARSILDEVLNEGNDDQKKEAQELMQHL